MSHGAQAAGTAARTLDGRILTRVFLRSLLLQASWNRRGMQNLGVAYALWPALVRLYPDDAARRAAASRHLAFFNTHPYLAAAILGGALHHEERVAAGTEPPEAVERFKASLMGPFGAVGDSFFWLSLRPAAGVWAALAAPFLGLWAVALFLLLYNLPHLLVRIGLFLGGYRSGEQVVRQLAKAGLPKWGLRLRRATVVGGGAAVVVAIHQLADGQQPATLPLAGFAALAAFGGAWALVERVGAHWAGVGAVVAGIGLALAGAWW